MSLENKVEDKESKSFAKKAFRLGFNVAAAAATTALSMATVGTVGPIVGAAFAGGSMIGHLIKGKPLYESTVDALRTYTGVNAVIWPIVALGNATFPLISNETIIGKAARTLYASTLYNAAFVGAFRGATHLVDNYLNPVGIVKSIKDNFYNEWKRIGLGFLPGYALDANGITNIMGLPTFALNAFPLGLYNAIKPTPIAKKSSHSNYSPGYSTPSMSPHPA
ncbi:MAG: hypothetical protein AABX00_05780 [Nanoarchaeota archaeon]